MTASPIEQPDHQPPPSLRAVSAGEPFPINEVTAEVLRTEGDMDMHVLAGKVFERIPPRRRSEVLQVLLAGYVADVNRRLRNAPIPNDDEGDETSVGRAPAQNRSALLTRIEQARDAKLRARVSVDGAWKALGDCTCTDLLALAGERRRLAAENRAKAKAFTTVAEMLQDRGVETVAELSEDDLTEALRTLS